jgi:transcriptional regulator with XRE-family HTH domain
MCEFEFRGKKYRPQLDHLRAARGLTQESLAYATGYSLATIRNYEKGRTGVETIVKLSQLCKELNCTIHDLFEEIGQ